MNRVDGMEALDAVENGMIKLGQSRDIWQNDVVYAALAGARLLLLDALKKRPEPPKTGDLVPGSTVPSLPVLRPFCARGGRVRVL